MKKGILLALLLLACGSVWAQKPLTNSRKSSFYTYVYKLDDAAVRLFYTDGQNKLSDKILGIPIDSCWTDKPRDWQLPAGNYLQVRANGNKLDYILIENHSAWLKLLDNSPDTRFVLLDADNQQISNAEVYAGKHKVAYDVALNLYHEPRHKKDTLLVVNYKGVSNFYKVKQQGQYRPYRYGHPSNWFKQLWASVRNRFRMLFSKKRPNKTQTVPTAGYMVFNKPKFKPNDTVKLKAFLLDTKSLKPIPDAKLEVRLHYTYNDKGQLLGYANAYNKGGFAFDFKLSDSLKLQLDRSYNITLEGADNKYDPDKDEEKYMANRKIYRQLSFNYEDYELTVNKFIVRADKTEHAPGQPAALYFRATDDNGLDIADGRVSITLITQNVGQFSGHHVFVPDTLWKKDMPLDPVGETKLLIPDSIFPKARISYRAQVVFLNSNNERKEDIKYLTYTNDPIKIEHQQSGDTLKVNYLVLGKQQAVQAMLYKLSDGNDTLSRTKITLPARLMIDPVVAIYEIKTDSLTEQIEAGTLDAGFYGNAAVTKDSLQIGAFNPRHLQFWYTVFSGDKVIDKGTGTNLAYKKPFNDSKRVSVQFNYIWAGKMQSQETTAAFQDKALVIDVKQPSVVYPGQQTDITINVKDAKGNPVPNADLTAYALTSKFEGYNIPRVPYLGKTYPGRKPGVPLMINTLATTGDFKLDWQRWSKAMGLDSIIYYQFMHPANVYKITEATPDTSAQIAPFVVKDGDIIPVHILYIDNVPVYFSKTQDMQHYSFMVKAGLHNLRFRTENQNIVLDDVLVKAGKKLILAVNADTVMNKQATFKAMPDTLTKYEADLINKYMVSIVPNFGEHLATISQNGRIFLLGANNVQMNGYAYRNQSPTVLVGPVQSNTVAFTVIGQAPRYFITEPDYSFQFEPGLLKQKSLPVKYPFGKDLNTGGITDFTQYALTPKAIDTAWQNYLDVRSHNTDLFASGYTSPSGSGELNVKVDKQKNGTIPFIKSIIVYKNDDPDYARVFAGSRINLGYFAPGSYRIMYLLKGNSYFIQDGITVKSYGHNFYSTGNIKPHAKDSVSMKIAGVIDNHEMYTYNNNDVQQIKEIFNEAYLDLSVLSGTMSGHVYDQESKQSLPGVSIRVRGVNAGVTTNLDGYFSLKVPKSGRLVFSFIGYTFQDIPIRPGQDIKLYLSPSQNMLNEVVVVGYGAQAKKSLSASIITIYKTDTVQYMASSYKIRGNATVDELLKKMEGFEVDKDGNITAQGRAITKVRLNGKDVFGGDINAAMRNLPADVIQNIQMIDDYGDQASITGIKSGNPQKILNIITDNNAFAAALAGKIAGVQIMIRGNGSVANGDKPLIVVDGVVYEGDFSKIDPATIGDISVLKDAAATALYGARAAKGVVIIQSRKNMLSTEAADGNQKQTIRKNFSDYAYWQPKLVTDAQGNATFKTTFPDDITSWRTFVIGMTANRQSGVLEGRIKSYKPLSANFTAPLFAVKGDILNPIAKVLNYTADTVNVKRTFKYNGELVGEKDLRVKNSVIDTFKLTAQGKDSLNFEYTVKRSNGYFDGEKRSIPLFEQGTLETRGMFESLEKDTTITIKLDPKLKEGTFRAEASVLPALLDEAQHLRDYEYLCNEQLASKLKGLLAEKKIRAYLGEPFLYDKNITEIIKKLQDSRRTQGTWGWWKDTDEELWISIHVVEAMIEAEAQGFKTLLDKAKLTDYLFYQANAYHGEDKLTVMLLLRKLGANKVDYESLIKEYVKQINPKNKPGHYDQLRLMLVKQQQGLAFDRDSLNKWKHETMFGNIYWGADSYNFFYNSIQESLLAYQILKTEGKHPEMLAKLRNYFLEQRKDGYWRNTYESAQILETILPDLLINGKKPEPSVITLNGEKNETVTKFPYTTSLTGGTTLTVKKTGTMPVYVTAYQKFWNPAPEKVSKDFTVNTTFQKNSSPVTRAKGGETIVLKAEVIARADADFVMVEIPIPAGCSYQNKTQVYGNGEVHREYFKNKVSIFCRKLTQGKHEFTVSLTARYGGTYQVNPAKAEMMYFPVFYGREGMKVFSIE